MNSASATMGAIASNLPQMGEEWDHWVPHSPAESTPYLVTVFMAVVLLYLCRDAKSPSGFRSLPSINPSRSIFSNVKAKREFLRSAPKLLAGARSEYPDQPYRIVTDMGEIAMLPPSLADEVRNEPKLSFSEATYVDFHGGIRGFEPFGMTREDQLLQTIARKQLTKSLSKVTEPLSEEAAYGFSVNFGDSPEWKQITLKETLLDIVARMSSRVFLNDQLCRNEDWLRVTKAYTVNVFTAATHLRVYPRWSRPLVTWFLSDCRKLQAQSEEARRVIAPAVEQRRAARAAAMAAGEPVPEFNDALDWFEQEAQAKHASYDPATSQLLLSLVAIHTTTDLLVQVIVDLAAHREMLAPLREEIAQQLRAHGWQKAALFNMKLLDSVIKESQRMKPISISSMRRVVQDDLQLSTGLHLKKGERISVDSCRMWDPAVHDDPQRWDGYRFFRMREQPSTANAAHLVATSANHIAFGHGEHACPGRFFAANELKVALCHMLLKYEWEVVEGSEVTPLVLGFSSPSNPTTQIAFRRRGEKEVEVDIDNL